MQISINFCLIGRVQRESDELFYAVRSLVTVRNLQLTENSFQLILRIEYSWKFGPASKKIGLETNDSDRKERISLQST